MPKRVQKAKKFTPADEAQKWIWNSALYNELRGTQGVEANEGAGIVGKTDRNPEFFIVIAGQKMKWKKQEARIRTDFPLSQYLFLVVMAIIFHDIHKGNALGLKNEGMEGFTFDEVLYADGPILFLKNP